MVSAERAAPSLEGLFEARLRVGELGLCLQDAAQVVDHRERLRVIVTVGATTSGDDSSVVGLRLLDRLALTTLRDKLSKIFTQFLSAWGPCSGCDEDLDGSGQVGFSDVTIVLNSWGPCP